MNLRKHRIAAITILAAEIVVLLAWGRSMAVDSGDVKTVRDRFHGRWVASSIQAGGSRKLEGAEAEKCSVEFDGKSVLIRGMVNDLDARGTFYIESSHPNWIDLKLDAGWIIGVFEFDGDVLKLCLNPLAPPEQLGVPTLARPREFLSGRSRIVYEFRKASNGS